jgi:hypothetical protein
MMTVVSRPKIYAVYIGKDGTPLFFEAKEIFVRDMKILL